MNLVGSPNWISGVALCADLGQLLLTPQLLQLTLAVEHGQFVLALILLVEELQDFRSQAKDAAKDAAKQAATQNLKHCCLRW